MLRKRNARRWVGWAVGLLVACYGCLEQPTLESAPSAEDPESAGEPVGLSLLTWNVAWLGSPDQGPDDEQRQLRGVIDTLRAFPSDLVALQEVATPESLQDILRALPDYAAVESAYDWSQQVALLYRRARFELEGFEEWRDVQSAGRAPLLVKLQARPFGRSIRVVVIHAKANVDIASYQERVRFAGRLRDRLQRDDQASEPLVLAGDFNDQISRSIVEGLPSPYAGLVEGLLSTPTAELEHGDEPSTIWGSVIDHVALTAPLWEAAGWTATPDVLRDEVLERDAAFSSVVSDHFPVRLKLSRTTP